MVSIISVIFEPHQYGSTRPSFEYLPLSRRDRNSEITFRLRFGPVLVDVTKDKTVSTIGYNGQVPGPLIRLREGQPVSVQVFNDTETIELVLPGPEFYVVALDGNLDRHPNKVTPNVRRCARKRLGRRHMVQRHEGSRLRIRIEGPAAPQAMREIEQLVQSWFDEDQI
jgi:Multicopper oxidase